MDSLEAMDHIDKLFLTVKESLWLPQWSFDFWTIPYLIGKGISFGRFRELMTAAHQMLTLEMASVPEYQKHALATRVFAADGEDRQETGVRLCDIGSTD